MAQPGKGIDEFREMARHAFHDTPTATATTDDLLRELIDEVRGLRDDIKMHEIRTGKRLIGQP
jgi:hypothetical protein